MVVKIKYKFLIVLISLCFLVNLVSAQISPSYSLKLFSEKSVYTSGETILVSAEVKNFREHTAMVSLESFLNNQKGNSPLSVIPSEFVLKPNETKEVILYDIFVDESMISDFYTVNTDLAFNSEKITKKSLQFEIIDTLKEIVLDVNTCKDSKCKSESKVFIKNEDIYLDYSSSVQDLNIQATLIYPDKTSEQVNLPTSIKASQVGTYKLEITASKEGYKSVTKREQFAVIEKNAEIKDIDFTGRAIYGDSKNKFMSNKIYLWAIAIISIVVVIIILFYFIRRGIMRKGGLGSESAQQGFPA